MAWAPRNCVFTLTGPNPHNTTTCEGTDWYFNHGTGATYSHWGFAKEGDGVEKVTCDELTTGCDECRLCWQINTYYGIRCGSDQLWLEDDEKRQKLNAKYERVIFQSGEIQSVLTSKSITIQSKLNSSFPQLEYLNF